jgi:hypothetical protein
MRRTPSGVASREETPEVAMTRRCILAALAAILSSTAAHAQCNTWHVGPLFSRVGTGTEADACTLWDPDGAGPATAQPVVGGAFDYPGGAYIPHLARWDGSMWQQVGNGVTEEQDLYSSWVAALGTYPAGTPFAGQLVVGGRFDHANNATVAVRNIARFDGSAWHNFDAGVDGIVHAITFWDPDGAGLSGPQLVIGGEFITAGGVTVRGVARWDGSAWQPLGVGLGDLSNQEADPIDVEALAVWDPDGPGPQPAQLFAGGYFRGSGGVPVNGIARWDGAQWQPLTTGVDTELGGTDFVLPGVESLAVWDPDGAGPRQPVLVVGGDFVNAGGIPVRGIATWNGSSWAGFAGGMGGAVLGLTVFNGQLIAGGAFQISNISPADGVAAWTGSSWVSLGQGLNYSVKGLLPWTPPGTTTQQLFAVGGFTSSGDVQLDGASTYDGTTWRPLMPPSTEIDVYTMAQLGANIIVGGIYDTSPGLSNGIRNLCSWNGADLSPIGNPNAQVRALKTYTAGFPGSQTLVLVAAGDFTSISTINANRIAIYTQPPMLADGTWSAMGPGFTGLVESLERYSNVIYAGGAFTASGVQPINHIAFWNGSAWQQVGLGVDGSVIAMKVYNGALYVGGSFTHAGSIATGGLARWDGANWTQVGGTFPGTVYSLEVYNGQLQIGGVFSWLSGNPNLLQYDSTSNTYSVHGSGGANQVVRGICVGPDGALYVGGDFSSVGGVSANRVAKWNGLAWSAPSGGADDNVFALCPFYTEVEAGGVFTNVNFATLPSAGWARLAVTGVPWIIQQPAPFGPVCAGATAHLYTRVATTYDQTFAWRHNGAPVAGGSFQGTWVSEYPHAGQIIFSNTHGTDSGAYDCVISTSCGSTTTIAVHVAINSADFNGDGALGTDADIEAFFACISGSCCAACGSADFNADGALGTDADIESFFRVLGGGPCGP